MEYSVAKHLYPLTKQCHTKQPFADVAIALVYAGARQFFTNPQPMDESIG